MDCDHIQRKLLVDENKEPSLDFLHSAQKFRFEIPTIVNLSMRDSGLMLFQIFKNDMGA